jgi:hypothetical protein
MGEVFLHSEIISCQSEQKFESDVDTAYGSN